MVAGELVVETEALRAFPHQARRDPVFVARKLPGEQGPPVLLVVPLGQFQTLHGAGGWCRSSSVAVSDPAAFRPLPAELLPGAGQVPAGLSAVRVLRPQDAVDEGEGLREPPLGLCVVAGKIVGRGQIVQRGEIEHRPLSLGLLVERKGLLEEALGVRGTARWPWRPRRGC